MLEIFAVISLCRVNKNNAIKRGRKPGGFIALTIILWVVFEIIGMIIGTLIFDGEGSYFTALFIALPCAALGGLISFLIAKNAPMGDYVDPSTIPGPVVTVSPEGAPVYSDPNVPAYMLQQVPAQPVQSFQQVQPMQPVQAAQPMQPVIRQGAGPVAGMRYCRFCGAANNFTSKFCESCGQNIE